MDHIENPPKYHNTPSEKITEELRVQESVHLDAIRGCLVGGAAGDALGYPVEFQSYREIVTQYGKKGITSYVYDPCSGQALISDDTQMTLFTANGLLFGETRHRCRGIGAMPRTYIELAYHDWLRTQKSSFSQAGISELEPFFQKVSWLCDVPELYHWRAPGSTCMTGLHERSRAKDSPSSYVDTPVNNRKGCGGVMRVAPLALRQWRTIQALDREAAEVAAITHGHPLGFLTASILCHIINRIVFPAENRQELKEIVFEAVDTVSALYGSKYPSDVEQLAQIINQAVLLSENDAADVDNIRSLGEGWVAEETLVIAIYCSLRHQNDFSAGVIAAVNHSGDSDSTGAVTGNILGALLGYSAIEEKWIKHLELIDVIDEMAYDLCRGCPISEYSPHRDPNWARKYIHAKWKEG